MKPTEGNLTVEIKNSQPVELVDFTRSFLCLADEYKRFISKNDVVCSDDLKLYIKEVRTGSLIVELIPMAVGVLPFLEYFNTVGDFCTHLSAIFCYLSGKTSKGPETDKKTLENVVGIVEPVVKDRASQTNFSSIINGDVHHHFYINYTEANAIQNAAKREIESLKEPLAGFKEKVILYFYQARNDSKSQTGDRGIIESVYRRPVKLIFKNELIKTEVFGLPENIFNYAFVVDVAVETIEDKPVIYKVTHIYEKFLREDS